MGRKRGAKPDFILHPDTGIAIEGLYTNKDKRGRVRFYYYLDVYSKQRSCTSDIRKAIKRYRDYLDENKSPDLIQIPEQAQEIPVGKYGAIHIDDHVNKKWVIEKFQRILNDDRKLVVDVTGNSNYWDF
jgi:hypothetical protein